jgi:hypothetical protein
MTIFDLHSSVLRDYQDCIGSYYTIADERISAFVSQALINDLRLWPDFLLQLSPCYARTQDVDALTREGLLHPPLHWHFSPLISSPPRSISIPTLPLHKRKCGHFRPGSLPALTGHGVSSQFSSVTYNRLQAGCYRTVDLDFKDHMIYFL